MKETLRIVGIVIQKGRLLLVKGSNKYKEYRTTGGTSEIGELEIDTLKREFIEEVGLEMTSATYFGEYIGDAPYKKNTIIRNHVYIASVKGEINVGHEIQGFVRMSKKEFEDGKYPLVASTREQIIPALIKAGFF